MNSSLTAFQAGARNLLRFKRMGFLLWFCNTFLALILTAPFAALIVSNLGNSKFGGEMSGSMDVQWLAEFLHFSRGLPVTMGIPFVVLIGLAALPMATFLAGGALWLLVRQATSYSPQRFFEGCGKFFWRFFRLFLFSLVFYTIVLMFSKSLDKFAVKLWGEGLADTPLVYFGWAKTIVVLTLFAIVNMVFDYAKIRLVAEDSYRSFRAIFWSLRFCSRNFRATFLTYLLTAALGALFLVVYFLVTLPSDRAAMPAILGVFVVMQLYVLSRIWLRLQFWASETELYHALNPAPPEPPAPEPAQPEPVFVEPVAAEPVPPAEEIAG